MRLSRPCYDKMHRCPGWAGGGMKFAKVYRCDNGFLDPAVYDRPMFRFRFNQCPKCGVWVLPYVVRYLDWQWWKSELWFWWKYRR